MFVTREVEVRSIIGEYRKPYLVIFAGVGVEGVDRVKGGEQ